MIDPSFQQWRRKGIKCVKDLFKGGRFITFELLKKDFGIPQADFFRYLQVRSYVKSNFSLTLPPETWLDECLDMNPCDKGLVSAIYGRVQSAASPSLNHLRNIWEEELGELFTDSAWQAAITRIHSSSICIRHGLLQFKVLHRLHLSPSRIAKMYPGADSSRPRCGRGPADLSHMFWLCPKLHTFWQAIFKTISFMCKRNIDPCFITALFGVGSPDTPITTHQANAIAFVTLLARCLILFNWKKAAPSSHKRWVEDVMSHLKLEHLKHTVSDSIQKYIVTWQPFPLYFETEFNRE